MNGRGNKYLKAQMLDLNPKVHTKEQLVDALEWALMIIDSYELDCRHLNEYLKENDPEGFCQGSIYKNVDERIKEKLGL